MKSRSPRTRREWTSIRRGTCSTRQFLGPSGEAGTSHGRGGLKKNSSLGGKRGFPPNTPPRRQKAKGHPEMRVWIGPAGLLEKVPKNLRKRNRTSSNQKTKRTVFTRNCPKDIKRREKDDIGGNNYVVLKTLARKQPMEHKTV